MNNENVNILRRVIIKCRIEDIREDLDKILSEVSREGLATSELNTKIKIVEGYEKILDSIKRDPASMIIVRNELKMNSEQFDALYKGIYCIKKILDLAISANGIKDALQLND